MGENKAVQTNIDRKPDDAQWVDRVEKVWCNKGGLRGKGESKEKIKKGEPKETGGLIGKSLGPVWEVGPGKAKGTEGLQKKGYKTGPYMLPPPKGGVLSRPSLVPKKTRARSVHPTGGTFKKQGTQGWGTLGTKRDSGGVKIAGK